MIWLIIKLLLGLGLILIGANWLIDGSSSIARKFGLSEFVVGLTIVGIGTSTPEMVVSFISAIKGSPDMSVGNIIGSNIANTLLILGAVSIVAPIGLTKNNIYKDIPFAFASALILFLLGMDGMLNPDRTNLISRIDAAVFLIGFILFMIYSFRSSKSEPQLPDIAVEDVGEQKPKLPEHNVAFYSFIILIGLAALIFGGELFVNSGSAIASRFGVSDAFIGITVMAVGTSLPELAASMVAAIKKRGQMALGNIIGSNISNIFLILGGSAMIAPLQTTSITLVDMSLLLVSQLLMMLCAFLFTKKMIDRWEGVLFVLIYIGYIIWLAGAL